MTPDLHAAAERLRQHKSVTSQPDSPYACNGRYGCSIDHDRIADDQGTLADFALSLLDPTPIKDCYATDPANWRDEWLLSIGFLPDEDEDYLFINRGHDAMHDLQAMAAGPWRLADPEGFVEIPRPKTRGNVTALLFALGATK